MLKYFDILYIRIYRQYVKRGERDIPKYKSVLLLSLFQSFNLVGGYILIRWMFERNEWTLWGWQMAAIQVVTAGFDLWWIFKYRGFDTLNAEYDELPKSKLVLPPLLYFLLSLAALVSLKLFGLFPIIK